MVSENTASPLKYEEVDKETIIDIIEGNTDLFTKIIDCYQKKVLLLVEKFIFDKDEVDDAVQEIFIKIFNNIKKFKSKSKLGTWIYRITVNYCLEYKRKKNKYKKLRLVKEDGSDIEHLITDEVTPDEVLKKKEIKKNLMKLIDEKLSKNQKMIFILKHFDNLQIKEITNIMGMKEGTVKTHLSRSYAKIREDLRSLFYE